MPKKVIKFVVVVVYLFGPKDGEFKTVREPVCISKVNMKQNYNQKIIYATTTRNIYGKSLRENLVKNNTLIQKRV